MSNLDVAIFCPRSDCWFKTTQKSHAYRHRTHTCARCGYGAYSRHPDKLANAIFDNDETTINKILAAGGSNLETSPDRLDMVECVASPPSPDCWKQYRQFRAPNGRDFRIPKPFWAMAIALPKGKPIQVDPIFSRCDMSGDDDRIALLEFVVACGCDITTKDQSWVSNTFVEMRGPAIPSTVRILEFAIACGAVDLYRRKFPWNDGTRDRELRDVLDFQGNWHCAFISSTKPITSQFAFFNKPSDEPWVGNSGVANARQFTRMPLGQSYHEIFMNSGCKTLISAVKNGLSGFNRERAAILARVGLIRMPAALCRIIRDYCFSMYIDTEPIRSFVV